MNQDGAPNIPNYLVQSILVTLCCCLPLGIVAIIKASSVNNLIANGDYEGAQAASDEAKKWCTYGLVLGIISNLLVVGLQIIGAVAQAR